MKSRIAIFASGSGTNAENIIRYFQDSKSIEVALVLCNIPDAGVIARAKSFGVECIVFSREDFRSQNTISKILQDRSIDFIALAGFLWLVPDDLIRSFNNRIVNIHPALLPDFGGKGFFGAKVHKAVLASGTPMSGITIHHVNEKFDEGAIIFQAACHVSSDDNVESLAKKIHALEYKFYPVVIEKIIRASGNLN